MNSGRHWFTFSSLWSRLIIASKGLQIFDDLLYAYSEMRACAGPHLCNDCDITILVGYMVQTQHASTPAYMMHARQSLCPQISVGCACHQRAIIRLNFEEEATIQVFVDVKDSAILVGVS